MIRHKKPSKHSGRNRGPSVNDEGFVEFFPPYFNINFVFNFSYPISLSNPEERRPVTVVACYNSGIGEKKCYLI